MKKIILFLLLCFPVVAFAHPPPIPTPTGIGASGTSVVNNWCKTITNPNDADSLRVFANQSGASWTINEVRANSISGTSVVFTLQECDANAANCVASMNALTVTTGTAGTATITDDTIDDNDFLNIDVGTVTGAVTQLIVCVEVAQ